MAGLDTLTTLICGTIGICVVASVLNGSWIGKKEFLNSLHNLFFDLFNNSKKTLSNLYNNFKNFFTSGTPVKNQFIPVKQTILDFPFHVIFAYNLHRYYASEPSSISEVGNNKILCEGIKHEPSSHHYF